MQNLWKLKYIFSKNYLRNFLSTLNWTVLINLSKLNFFSFIEFRFFLILSNIFFSGFWEFFQKNSKKNSISFPKKLKKKIPSLFERFLKKNFFQEFCFRKRIFMSLHQKKMKLCFSIFFWLRFAGFSELRIANSFFTLLNFSKSIFYNQFFSNFSPYTRSFSWWKYISIDDLIQNLVAYIVSTCICIDRNTSIIKTLNKVYPLGYW